MDKISEDQYESDNTSCEESDKTSDSSDESNSSDESSTSDSSGKSGKFKRKKAKKNGIFYDNIDLISHMFWSIDIYYFIIELKKKRKNLPKRRKLYLRIIDMDKNLREALRVTKNFAFNYFYYNKTYKL